MIEQIRTEPKFSFKTCEDRMNSNERSTSLPLKMMLDRAPKQKNNQLTARSWTDNSFFNSNTIDCYLVKFSQLSRSERCLDLIEIKSQDSYRANINSVDSLSSTSSMLTSLNLNAIKKIVRNNSEDNLTTSSSEESISDNNFKLNSQTVISNNVYLDIEPSGSQFIHNFKENLNLNAEAANIIDKNENAIIKTNSVATESVQENLDEPILTEKSDELEQTTTKPLIPESKLEETSSLTMDESNNTTSISDSSYLSTTLNDTNSSLNKSNSPPASPTFPPTKNTKNLKIRIDNDTLSGDIFENDSTQISSNDSPLLCSENDFIIRAFMPKKSCLANKSKLFADLADESSLMESQVNATSSPLASPLSMNSSSLSQWSSTENTGSFFSQNHSLSSTTNSSKKRVSFADVCGKDLCTVRTMSEPSNCPPKLTSKIVEYFLNREFNSNTSPNTINQNNAFQIPTEYITNCMQKRDPFFSKNRNYEYGISGLNYTNDVNQLKGSIAVYSLNFAQPASDYFKFRKRLEENCVSLENVLLNGFQINGTLKVKNINYNKSVFIRCSFNKWQTYEDFPAVYVPCDFYSSSSSLSSPTTSSISAAFYGINNSHYEPQHKEYDSFRFEFQLPKEAEPEIMDKLITQSSQNANNNDNITASIQFCICYTSGTGDTRVEHWDSNGGSNYEILQYVIDLERLKPFKQQQTNSKLSLKNKIKKNNVFKYESFYSNSSSSSGSLTSSCLSQDTNLISGIYY